MDVHVEPSEERLAAVNEDYLIQSSTFNVSSLNLTWTPISYEKDLLLIQLNFTNPEFVSDGDYNDTIVVGFKDKSSFVSAEILKDLSTNKTSGSLPKIV